MEDQSNLPTRALEVYASSPVLRAAVAGIPVLGGSVDALFGQWGADLVQRRVEVMLAELAKETARIDQVKVDKEFLNSEEFADLFIRLYRQSARTRYREKVRLYCRVLAGRASCDWDERTDAEDILAILADLSPGQVAIMFRMWNRAFGRAVAIDTVPEGEETPFDYQRLAVIGLLSAPSVSIDHPERLGAGYRMTDMFRTVMRVIEDEHELRP